MANPVQTIIPKKTWTKVATSVTAGKVSVQDGAKVLYTYSSSPSVAPTSNATAVQIRGGEVTISAAVASDVWCFSTQKTSVVFFS